MPNASHFNKLNPKLSQQFIQDLLKLPMDLNMFCCLDCEFTSIANILDNSKIFCKNLEWLSQSQKIFLKNGNTALLIHQQPAAVTIYNRI
jgi:hypothetical protein